MKFEIGEKVKFLNEQGGGVVKKYESNNWVVVETYEGFDISYPESELVPAELKPDPTETPEPKPSDKPKAKPNFAGLAGREKAKKKKKKLEKRLGIRIDELEVDLHADKLRTVRAGMDSGEILRAQMAAAKRAVQKGYKGDYHKVVLIHGKGEGVLKTEIYSWLTTLHDIEFGEASYFRYGNGATDVIFK